MTHTDEREPKAGRALKKYWWCNNSNKSSGKMQLNRGDVWISGKHTPFLKVRYGRSCATVISSRPPPHRKSMLVLCLLSPFNLKPPPHPLFVFVSILYLVYKVHGLCEKLWSMLREILVLMHIHIHTFCAAFVLYYIMELSRVERHFHGWDNPAIGFRTLPPGRLFFSFSAWRLYRHT